MALPTLTDTTLNRIKSVASLTAHTPVLFQNNNFQFSEIDLFMSEIIRRNDLSVQEKAIIELLYYFGLRISEVLQIKKTDISPMCHILVKGSKGSNNRIVQPVVFRSFWLSATVGDLPLCNIYSRFYFYRLFKKIGFYSKFGTNEKFSVTHFFRHQLVLSFKSAGFPDETITQFIAHRSFRSLEYYAGERKK